MKVHSKLYSSLNASGETKQRGILNRCMGQEATYGQVNTDDQISPAVQKGVSQNPNRNHHPKVYSYETNTSTPYSDKKTHQILVQKSYRTLKNSIFPSIPHHPISPSLSPSSPHRLLAPTRQVKTPNPCPFPSFKGRARSLNNLKQH